MPLVIVWEMPDGSIAVTVPGDAIKRLPDETEAAYLDRVADDAQARLPELAGAVRHPHIDRTALPSRRWRNAWRRVAGRVVVAPNAARGLRRAEVLAAREERLARVRARIAEAVEDDAAPAVIAALKQKARSLRALDDATLTARLAQVAVADLDGWTPAEFTDT